jgi:hypothetical protein
MRFMAAVSIELIGQSAAILPVNFPAASPEK